MINGHFEDGSDGWTLVQEAFVSSAYGAYSPPNALVMLAPFPSDPAAIVHQTFAVEAGRTLQGRLMLSRQAVDDYDTTFEVYWDSALKYTMNAFSMVLDQWILFEIQFATSETKEFRMLLNQEDPGPPYVPVSPPQHRFLVDALEFEVVGEASMIAESLMKWIDTPEGFGTEGTDIFCSHMPDSPDNCIAVYDESTGALSVSQALNYDRFGIEIRVRNTEYGSARDICVEIHKALAGFAGLLAPSTPEVIMVDVVTSPTFLERDGSKRSVWVAHYALTVVSSGDQYRT